MRLSVHPFLIKYRQLNKSTYLQNIFQIIQTFIFTWTKTVSLRLPSRSVENSTVLTAGKKVSRDGGGARRSFARIVYPHLARFVDNPRCARYTQC